MTLVKLRQRVRRGDTQHERVHKILRDRVEHIEQLSFVCLDQAQHVRHAHEQRRHMPADRRIVQNDAILGVVVQGSAMVSHCRALGVRPSVPDIDEVVAAHRPDKSTGVVQTRAPRLRARCRACVVQTRRVFFFVLKTGPSSRKGGSVVWKIGFPAGCINEHHRSFPVRIEGTLDPRTGQLRRSWPEPGSQNLGATATKA